jgi:hypothetical protein
VSPGAPTARHSARTVVVSTTGLEDDLAACIREACQHAGALPLSWAGDSADPGVAMEPGAAAGAVLAALGPGERQIPDHLVRFVTEERPGAPLLLLCRESLVRPSVTLQNGRVTLVEPPFSVRRIASRLRVILASGPGQPPTSLHATVPGGDLVMTEYQRPGHWMGVLSLAEPDPAAPRWAPGIDQGRGLTAVVRAGPGAGDVDLEALVDLLTGGGAPEALADALPELVGPDDGVIHLPPRGDEWLLFWPRAERPLWLCSTMRLPPCWDLAATAQESPGRCLRVTAAGGDMVVALTAGLSDWALGAASPGVPALVPTELTDAVADGGPALLEAIAGRMRGQPGGAGALVIEAR